MIVEFGKEVEKPEKNKIICKGQGIKQNNSRIEFNGQGNLLYIDGDVTLVNSKISFNGDNALLYLSNSNKDYKLKIDLYRETTAFVGGNNYFNATLNIIVSERQSVIIGDHVWIGQNATILKGSVIGSGSILSANAMIAGKRVNSNSVWGGNPARMIKENIFFTKESCHNYTKQKTKESLKNNTNEYVYDSNETFDIKEIKQVIDNSNDPAIKAEALKSVLGDSKNRFFVEREGFIKKTIKRKKTTRPVF